MEIHHQASDFSTINIKVQTREELELLLCLFGGLSEDMVRELTGSNISEEFAYNVYSDLKGIAASCGINKHKQTNIKVVKY